MCAGDSSDSILAITASPLSTEETPMEVDGLVTALERIEHATRDFVHPSHKAEAPTALLDVLEECGRVLGHAHAIDPGLDDARNEASRHCAVVRKNLSAVLEDVRQLNLTVSGLLPTLVRIADRE